MSLLQIIAIGELVVLFLASIIVFVAGTEIRVRAEDRLLEERFQGAFVAYRSRVRAYIPGLR